MSSDRSGGIRTRSARLTCTNDATARQSPVGTPDFNRPRALFDSQFTGLMFYRSTASVPYRHFMAQHNTEQHRTTGAARVSFDVTLADGHTERVWGANAYQQEQSMTTFFNSSSDRQLRLLVCSVASFRTDSIMSIRRVPSGHSPADQRRHLVTV